MKKVFPFSSINTRSYKPLGLFSSGGGGGAI